MFGNKKLKIELDNALGNNERLRECVKEAEGRTRKYQDRAFSYEKELKTLKITYASCQKELEEVKAKVRAQNEADLMFVSVKIIADLLKGKKKKDVKSELEWQREAYNAMLQMQAQSNFIPSERSSLLNILG